MAALRGRLPERTALSVFLIVLAILLAYTDWLWRWDQVIYDWELRLWSRPAPDDIVIVAIDEQSLAELGRWPWPRRIHAELIDKLTAAGARVIGLDVVFAEPNMADPDGDAVLAKAVQDSGRVVLPLLIESVRLRGQLKETLPFPPLAGAAAGLGHANNTEPDRDGIIRSVYLRSGLAQPFWPSMALTILQFLEPGEWQNLPGQRNPEPQHQSSNILTRDYQIWIPFPGPPGHFDHLSYVDSLRGHLLPEMFRDKIVLVGATAAGLDDQPTPVSDAHNPMPGVELMANELDTLRQGLAIHPLAVTWRLLLTAGLVLLPFLLYAHLTPRWALLAAVLSLALTTACSVTLLRTAQLWFPPSAALLALILGYLLWSWRWLESTARYLNQELLRLYAEPAMLQDMGPPKLAIVMGFLQHVLPVDGCILYDTSGNIQDQWGKTLKPASAEPPMGSWRQEENGLWTTLQHREGPWRLGLHWRSPDAPTEAQQTLLMRFALRFTEKRVVQPTITPVELIQTRILQVQQATARLRFMRGFITDCLAQMADGVVVANSLGEVLLANPKAASYLVEDADKNLAGMFLAELLTRMEFTGTPTWQQALQSVLLAQQTMQLSARDRSGRDLLMLMAPFTWEGNAGLVVNFTDISQLKASERQRAELLSFLSHDLRSPLVSVIALTHLAELKPDKLGDSRFINQIEEYTRKTLNLVDDFLQLARAESSVEIPFQEVNFVSVAQDAVEQLQPQAAAKGTALEQRIQVEEAWLLGEWNLLERMLINLLDNAIKYSPDGAAVTLGVDRTGDQIRCYVRDTGYGIASEDIPKLFERFHRFEQHKHKIANGTGLGLAFVKTVVDRHQGRIEVESKPGKGSCFCLSLPVVPARRTDPEIQAVE